MNRQRMILPAVALILGVGGTLAVAAALPGQGDTPAQAPATVQTLNAAPTDTSTPPVTVADTPTVEVTPTPAPTQEPVQTLNDPAPVTTPSPEATTPPTTVGNPATTTPRECAPWMEPGWAGASCIWAMPNDGGTLELKACEQEDSQNCYWDATMRGNGQGRSFINIRGHLFYEEAGQ